MSKQNAFMDDFGLDDDFEDDFGKDDMDLSESFDMAMGGTDSPAQPRLIRRPWQLSQMMR